MKKTVCLTLALLTLFALSLGLAACGKNETPSAEEVPSVDEEALLNEADSVLTDFNKSASLVRLKRSYVEEDGEKRYLVVIESKSSLSEIAGNTDPDDIDSFSNKLAEEMVNLQVQAYTALSEIFKGTDIKCVVANKGLDGNIMNILDERGMTDGNG